MSPSLGAVVSLCCHRRSIFQHEQFLKRSSPFDGDTGERASHLRLAAQEGRLRAGTKSGITQLSGDLEEEVVRLQGLGPFLLQIKEGGEALLGSFFDRAVGQSSHRDYSYLGVRRGEGGQLPAEALVSLQARSPKSETPSFYGSPQLLGKEARTWYFSVESEEEREGWITEINSSVKRFLHSGKLSAHTQLQLHDGDDEGEDSLADQERSLGEQEETVSSQEKELSQLEQELKEEEARLDKEEQELLALELELSKRGTPAPVWKAAVNTGTWVRSQNNPRGPPMFRS